MSSEAKVRIGSEIFLYRVKAPFVPSGVSVHGALEYDEAADKVRCHECGEWVAHMSGHLWRMHGMKARAYKIKHGLNQGTALCNEKIRAQLVAHGRTGRMCAFAAKGLANVKRHVSGGRIGPNHEQRNRNGVCQAQIMEKLLALAGQLGRTPKRKEMAAAGINAPSVEFVFGMKLPEVLRLASLKPRAHGEWQREHNCERKSKYTAIILAEMLRDFWVRFCRLPSESDFRRRLIPSWNSYHAAFGSMTNAYFAAGLEKVAADRPRGFRPVYTVAQLEAMLREFVSKRGRLPRSEDWAQGCGGELPTYKTYLRYIPNFRELTARIREEIARKAKEASVNQFTDSPAADVAV